MANDQNEFGLPTPDNDDRKSSAFLPRFFRTEANNKFLQATLDQLIQPGVAEKLNGFYGRRDAKAFSSKDSYVPDVSSNRENYQFEPAVVVKDNLDNVDFYKDYTDYINQIKFFNGNVDNHSRLNAQETYAWNPNVDWDKLVNFREYYWAPTGPISVPVRGQGKEVVSTYTVTLAEDDDNTSYVFNSTLEKNPTLKLYRGQTYRFEIDTPGHPIAFALSRTFLPGEVLVVAGREGIRGQGLFDSELFGNDYDIGDFIVTPDAGSVSFGDDENVSTIYNDGISKEATDGQELATVYVESGVVEFTIPLNAPDRLFYISKNNVDTSGQMRINNIEENTFLDVDKDIIGKKTYKSSNGVEFTNGLKVFFQGDVTPAIYEKDAWYVEGVGGQIRLVKESDLVLLNAFSEDDLVPWDGTPYDRLPFENSSAYPKTKDYLVVNRASPDRNPWSRYNRWFHKNVLEKSLEYNGLPVVIDESFRAKRPIIEFEAGLKLYRFGSEAKQDIDLVDTFTKDVFSTIEGSFGYNIDGVDLVDGMRVLFTADTDILVTGNIYEVKFVTIGNVPQITLQEVSDTFPQDLEVVFVRTGDTYGGTAFYYQYDVWNVAQQKDNVNQAPLFDLCCPEGNFYGDLATFDSSSFNGTKVFSYKEGTGANDPELGFPLTYKNINNSGDILFEFNLTTDSFTVQNDEEIITVEANKGNLRKYTDLTNFAWVNGWSSVAQITKQKVVRQYVAGPQLNNFEVDVYNRAGDLNDLAVSVYRNNRIQTAAADYEIDRVNGKALVRFYSDVAVDDKIVLKSHSATSKNNNGFYEFPINFERNPSNEDINEFTLGEAIDHVSSIVEETREFTGTYPGQSNLRDLGNVDRYGRRFVKHSGPINLALYHFTSKEYNIVKSIEFAKNEYATFKRTFLSRAESLGIDAPAKQHVDRLLQDLNRDKIKTQPFYFSDMIGYTTTNRIEFDVEDPDNPFYALTNPFNLTELSSRAINVYLNGSQLIHGKDYTFSEEGFVLVTAGQKDGDTIEVYEYETTDGSFIPPTPSKLGMYPKYEPQIVIDDTYQTEEPFAQGPFKIYGQNEDGCVGWFYPVYTNKKYAGQADCDDQATTLRFAGLSKLLYIPTTDGFFGAQDNPEIEEYSVGIAMVQGHDGSTIRAYKDYRDNLLLDLEKRIFNNIKVDYENTLLNIHDFVGGKYRSAAYNRKEINDLVLKDFIQWSRVVESDYTENDFYERENQYTYNYYKMTSAIDGEVLPGFWRGVYREFLDTDRPHSHPWEMLGFTLKPKWWDTTYGPAPYSANNLVLWQDIENGYVREPNKELVTRARYARPDFTKYIPVDSQGKLKSPIESGYAKNFFYRNTSDDFIFGDVAPVESAWRKSAEYPFALIKAWLLANPARVMGLGFDLSRVFRNLAGQYTYTDTLTQISNKSIVFPNTYRDNVRVNTSGLVNYIYNLLSSNIVSVYDDYKNDITSMNTQMGLRVGGFTDKSKFQLLLDSRSPRENIEDGVFVPEENYQVFLNTSSPIDAPVYSGIIVEKRANGFVVRGYFDNNPFLNYFDPIPTTNDRTIVVGGISETSVDWDPNKPFYDGQVVEFESQYYRATANFTSGDSFDAQNLIKLSEVPIVGGKRGVFYKNFDTRTTKRLSYGTRLKTSQDVVSFILGYGAYLESQGFDFNYFNDVNESIENWSQMAREFLFWTTQGWSAGTTISLSPSAYEVNFKRDFAVVDDIFDDFYEYSLRKSDGLPLERRFNSVQRNGNEFGIKVRENNDGVYNIVLPLVQKEHVVLLDNETIFGDVIYQPTTGYRQERIKVLGYRSDNWDGSLNIPGFVYDDARATEWESWKDYEIGSLVKYKQFFYVATFAVPGSKDFNPNFWIRLNEKPVAELLTNFDYRINQFTDFYDLDSDNFDSEQQRLAQHLIGYQKRDYLANIINDDVSQYKFYQGFIQDKGTKNAIEKLFNPLGSSDRDSLEFFEDWAIQLGRYGATTDIEQIEFELDETQFYEEPQGIEFVESIDPTIEDKVYRIRPMDLIDKPEGYTSTPFPTTTLKSFVIDSGYVHENDVEFKAGSKAEINSTDVNLLNKGQYIWLTDDGRDDWSVYQIHENFGNATTLATIDDVTEKNESLKEITVDAWVAEEVANGEFVAIRAAQDYNVNGFYEVYESKFNTLQIIVPEDNEIIDFDEELLIMVKLREVRIPDLTSVNDIIQQNIYDNQRIWIDDYSNAHWGVLENNSVYREQGTIVDITGDGSSQNGFSYDVDVSKKQTTMIVSSPGYTIDVNPDPEIDNFNTPGKVDLYTRNTETAMFIQQQPLTLETVLFNDDNARFGESVSISDDDTFIAVGIPGASSVKTRYRGEYLASAPYGKNDIVKYRNTLWQAHRDIEPEVDEGTGLDFNSFSSYVELRTANGDADLDSSLLLTGDPSLQLEEAQATDHILVRAPADQFEALIAGDEVRLQWNLQSYTNGDLDVREPFDGAITFEDSTIISKELIDNNGNGHSIVNKVDHIVRVDSYINPPQVGDILTTSTASATVVYTKIAGVNLIIYLADTTGVFAVSGSIFIQYETASGPLIGNYVEIEPTENQSLGGWWQIDTSPFSYINNENYTDAGKGLVYVDAYANGGTTNAVYYNVNDDENNTTDLINTSSYVQNLSYFNDITPVADSRWISRVNKSFADTLSLTEELNFYLYDLSNRTIDFANTGLNYGILNATQTLVDKWDGFIDIQLVADGLGNTFEPSISDIITDRQTPFDQFGQPSAADAQSTFTAEVVAYQTGLTNVRVYIKYTAGTYATINNLATTEIVLNPSVANGNTVNRVIGKVNDVEDSFVVNTSTNNLQFLVFEKDTDFDPADGFDPIINEEYWIYTEEDDNAGSFRSVYPTVLNKNYTQIYNIVADQFGSSSKTNEGAVAIYYKDAPGSYQLLLNLVSEYAYDSDTTNFGTKVELIKKDNEYTLYVSNAQGSVEIFKHGYTRDDTFKGNWRENNVYETNDIVYFLGDYYKALQPVFNQTSVSIGDKLLWRKVSWRRGVDDNFRGTFNSTDAAYGEGSIVNVTGVGLFRALTNVPIGAATPNTGSTNWEAISSGVDYLGVLPVNEGQALLGESEYFPTNFDSAMSENDPTVVDSDFAVTESGNYVIISEKRAAFDSSIISKVLVYRQRDNKYEKVQEINPPDDRDTFGSSVVINPAGTKIAISDQFNDDVKYNQGKIYIYSLVNQQFVLSQELKSPKNELAERFGDKMSFSSDNLIVSSARGDMIIPTTFDADSGVITTFDKGYTDFNNIILDSGTVYVYEEIENALIFSESFRYDLADFDFGENIFAKGNHVYIGMPKKGKLIEYRKPNEKFAWNKKRELIPPVDVSKIKGMFLYNKRTNSIVQYLDYIDPIQGKIAGPAKQELHYEMGIDPATYNVGAGPEVTEDTFWGPEHVGKLWWYTKTTRFTYPYQGDIQYQKANWNELQPGSFVNVFEWVESAVPPSNWDQIADSELGIQRGISGKSLYGDDFFSQTFDYDSVAQRFIPKYYFWVANKKTIPTDAVIDRKVSAFDVSRLIAQPRKEGYRFASLLAADRIVLNNIGSLIYNEDIVLNIRYTENERDEQNTHSQYQIISDGDENSVPHSEIERKWFDSLIGYDEQGRPVPNPDLSPKQKYGIQNKPRQGIFVNREEALKQYIERVNLVLLENIVVDEYDISALFETEPKPTSASKEFDLTVDTVDELRFISTNKVTPAILEPVIRNGKLAKVNILSAGRGYRSAPKYAIVGAGTDAEIELTLTNVGGISAVKILSRGTGYDENTRITVRRFSVLVNADTDADGRWAIWAWNEEASEWFRRSVQDYNVPLYWDYADWYATGYNEFTSSDFIITESYELTALADSIGDIVKIQNVGTGGWLLLEKVDNTGSEDYTVDYKTIGRQDGTIQFKESLYNTAKNKVGFDNRSYDSTFYDNDAQVELRIIFKAIRDSIFTSNLRREYNQLFFASLRYVMSEQQYVDWLFKTSYVKINHNLGEFDQDVTFDGNTLSSYEAYVNEVKPYKTVIREFVSVKERLEPTNSVITDFDLPPFYSETEKKIVPNRAIFQDGGLLNVDPNVSQYPRKNWLDNYGRQITNIMIGDAGSGYVFAPTVELVGGGGTGATAKAYIGYGKVTAIKVTNPGQGYTSAPAINIAVPQVENGVVARASAILGSGVVRSPSITIKFDRTSGKYYINSLAETETFVGSNSQTTFNLEWPMNLRLDTVTVTVDGKEMLRSQFTFRNVTNTDAGYIREQGQVTFTNPPALDANIVISYQKPLSMLSAEDRIQFGYTALSGMLGKDLAQLMTGVDYGGVEVTSFGFSEEQGWNTNDWYTDTWDEFDNSYEDYVFTFDGSTVAVGLDEPFESGTVYNVYLNGVRIDDPNFGTEEQLNEDAKLESITGDGTTDVFILSDYDIATEDGDIMIIRKITSDGTVAPDPASYDTQLTGGAFDKTTATGLKAEDIIVDGDSFVTATTSTGPEEMVPGQVMDTLDLRVYTRDSTGPGKIVSQYHITDGVNETFDLGATPSSLDAIVVKVDGIILTRGDYDVDWSNLTINIPDLTEGHALSIVTLEAGVQNVIDFGKAMTVADTDEYEINTYFKDGYGVFLTLDGENVEIGATKTEGKDTLTISLTVTPETGQTINYIVFDNNTEVNYSQVNKEVLIGDGASTVFPIAETPFFVEPTEHNCLVKVGNKILSSGYNIQYEIKSIDVREYAIESFQFPSTTIDTTNLRVFLNGAIIETPNRWLLNPNTNSIRLNDGTGDVGDLLEIYLISDSEYTFDNNNITFKYAPGVNERIEIIKFSNHDILGIEKQNYDVVSRFAIVPGSKEAKTYQRLSYGEIKLRKPAEDAQYVWVAKNGILLSPSVDYYITDDRLKVQLTTPPGTNDVIEVVQFATPVSVPKFAYRIFKDVLNRTHYKRINDAVTVLSKDLNYYDLRVEVEDASLLPAPDKKSNKPGIVWIDGERIEYLVKDGNLLRQLRRGTLGTGVKDTYSAGEEVFDQGARKTVPYNDRTVLRNFIGDGSQSITIGYKDSTLQASYGINEVEVFVGGRRLRKNEISKFSEVVALDSPDGDLVQQAEFTIDGDIISFDIQDDIHADGIPLNNEKIVVMRKTGRIWTLTGETLGETKTDIGSFIRAGN